MSNHRYELEHIFSTPPERLFDAFGEPDSLAKWWSPPGLEAVAVEIDFSVGGSYRIGMRAAGSTDPLFVTGSYLQLERPTILAFTHSFEPTPGAAGMKTSGLIGINTRVTISLQAVASGT